MADVLAEWDLGSDRLGYMVLDNASNNDTAIVALGKEFGFDPDERRLRYLGHVSNLAVKQLIFGEAADAMEHTGSSEPDSEYYFDSLPADTLAQWRRRGPISRLHNLNATVLNSPHKVARRRSQKRRP